MASQIYKTTGSILEPIEDKSIPKIDAIFHVANIRKAFGAGLAKQIKEMFPVVYEADLNYDDGGIPENRFGNFSSAVIGLDDLDYFSSITFYNLYAQDLRGRNLSESGTPFRVEHYLKAIDDALYDMTDRFPSLQTVACPWLIGCGLSGGNWEYVRNITEFMCGYYDINLVWVEYGG